MKEVENMKLGFIGLGSMSTAIIEGIKNSHDYDMNKIYASSRNTSKLEKHCDKLGINACITKEELIETSDVIIIAVKPEDLKELSKEVRILLKNKPIISMAAKTSFNNLIGYFGERPIIRIMPNLNVAINQGSTAIAMYNTSGSLNKFIDNLFNLLGKTYKLDEKQFSGFIAMAGSAPALIYRFINELSKAGVEEGFSKEEALSIVSQTFNGSSQYLSQSTDDPQALIARVSSKGGTTIEGLNVFDELNFDEMIRKAAEAIIIKDKKG